MNRLVFSLGISYFDGVKNHPCFQGLKSCSILMCPDVIYNNELNPLHFKIVQCFLFISEVKGHMLG